MTAGGERPPSFLRRHLARTTDDGDLLVGLACDENIWVRREAAGNPATPEWVLDLLHRAGAASDLRGTRPPDPTMPPTELRQLVECGPWAQQLVADHPNASGEILAVLASQASDRLRTAVAIHPSAEPDTLAHLCADGDETVRCRVAHRPDTPEAVLTMMWHAGADRDLVGVSGAPPASELDPGDLRRMATLGPWGRFLAGRIGACPPDLIRDVASDPDWRVRSSVLDNPNAADAQLAAGGGVGDDGEVRTLRVLAQASPAAAALASLAEHRQPEVRLAVARHPASGSDVIGTLAVDRVVDVRRTAVRHPRMDRTTLDLLVRGGSTPDLARLAPSHPSVTPAELDELSRGGYWARQLAVRHAETPGAALARLLCDDDPKLREWAAAHPAAPRDVVSLLLRAGAATDFQGIAPPEDPDMSHAELRRVAELGPYGELIVAWHPNRSE